MATPSDVSRLARAREALSNEGDALLKKGEKALKWYDNVPKDKKEKIKGILKVAGIMATAGAFYTTMMLMWFLVWHLSITWTVIVLALMVVACFVMCIMGVVRGSRLTFWIGLLTFEAVVVSVVCGFFCYYGELVYFYKYEELRTYTNVGASQSTTQFSDAGMFLYTEDSKLDAARAVGYASRWHGGTFCVAPITDSTMSNADNINYWAVGRDCCSPRGTFQCNDAQDQSTRSALIMLEPEEIVRSSMTWAVSNSLMDVYMNAIRLQEANFFTQSAPSPKLVYWSRDPIQMKDDYYHRAVVTCVVVSSIFFVLLLAESYVVVYFFLAAARGPKLGLPLRPGHPSFQKAA